MTTTARPVMAATAFTGRTVLVMLVLAPIATRLAGTSAAGSAARSINVDSNVTHKPIAVLRGADPTPEMFRTSTPRRT